MAFWVEASVSKFKNVVHPLKNRLKIIINVSVTQWIHCDDATLQKL